LSTLRSCLKVQPKVLSSGDDTERIRVAHSASPSLDTNDGISLVEDTKFDCIHDAPLQATIDILLPWLAVEVGLGLGKVEGVDTTVQVGVL
jgi:hypothetical protein